MRYVLLENPCFISNSCFVNIAGPREDNAMIWLTMSI